MKKARLRVNSTQGFTLIELLVVAVLIGIIATMGVLNLTNWLIQKEVKQEAQILQEKMHTLMDDAVISQLTLALRIYPDHIKIYERRSDGWQESLRNQQGAIKLSDGTKLTLLGQDNPATQNDDEQGVIYLGSDGRISPHTLRVEDQDTYCDSISDMAGNMTINDCKSK